MSKDGTENRQGNIAVPPERYQAKKDRARMNYSMCLLLIALSCASVFAQSSTYVDAKSQRRIVKWDDMVSRVIEVDGLAWGAQSKGLGAHLVLPNGKVYLRSINLTDSDLNGRLIRISGVLRKASTGPAPKGAQGYSERIDYFYVQPIEATRIDKVVRHQLLPSPHDWIVPGISIDEANALVRSRGLTKYGLALAASPDGSMAHSYRLGDNEVVVFYELNGQVKSVAKVQVSRVGRGGDKWTSVLGCRLPSKTNRQLRK